MDEEKSRAANVRAGAARQIDQGTFAFIPCLLLQPWGHSLFVPGEFTGEAYVVPFSAGWHMTMRRTRKAHGYGWKSSLLWVDDGTHDAWKAGRVDEMRSRSAKDLGLGKANN